MTRRDLLLGIIYIVAGIGMFVVSQVADMGGTAFARSAPGLGGALIAIGAIRLYRCIRMEKDPEYRENFEVETHDERNAWLRMKAWSWAGYLFVMIAACCTLIFAFMDKKELMQAASFSVCIILVLYWICYMIVRKKY